MANLIKKPKDEKSLTVFLALVCFITNMSQMPAFVESSITRIIAIPIWIVAAVLCIVRGFVVFNSKITTLVICSMALIIGILTLSIVSQNDYLNPDIVYCYCLSIFIFFIGFWISEKVSYESIKFIIGMYIISASILAINVYFSYLKSDFDIMSRSYAYGSKNSVSQIIFTGLIFLFTMYNPKHKIMIISKWITIIFLGMVILMLKSRATIIGIGLMICIAMLFGKSRNKMKALSIPLVVTLAISLTNNHIYDIIVNGILLGGRSASNLSDVSSGRFDEWVIFPQLISDNELFGIGKYKIESFPLSVLTQYGLILGTLFITVSLLPIIWGFKNRLKENEIHIAFLIIACCYWLNGIFEQLAPFGPGVKCYMLWLLFGILMRKKDYFKKVKC